jgi:cytochrome c oxidase subunit I+III
MTIAVAAPREQPERHLDVDGADLRSTLERTWSPQRGFVGWLCEVNHLAIGKRFLVTAFAFFALGGVEALLMRLQLARPENHFISPVLYDQLFSTHGSTMMFLFAVPVMQGLGLCFVPLMLGTRSVAFPRLAAYAYYTYLIGGLLLYAALFAKNGPDAGWFAYTPLSDKSYTPQKGVDVWAQMITFTELSGLATAVNLIVTTFKMRAPGMFLTRIPLFVWALLVTSFMIVFAMPAIMVASMMLAMDRLVHTHFFTPSEGGGPLLWQHLFWFFGHPEVYIIFIPGLGIVSSIVETFTRRPAFGYPAMVLSLVTTAIMGFGLWVHHMFATGLPQIGESFFTAASMIIALPTGVQFFCWIATMWSGRVRFEVPFLWVLGFVATFLIGGLTGVMLASVPLNLQMHDTFFVVAHLHYVLIGGAVFPLLGGVHYWFPKLTGRMPSRAFGVASFALIFVGFHLTFLPMHVLGLHGMTRRIYTYPAASGWGGLNLLATGGAVVLGLGLIVMVAGLVRSLRSGERAADDPWKAGTLEWATTSPPAPYAFEFLPAVSDGHPLWKREPAAKVVGLDREKREVLVTDVFDTEPDHRFIVPGPSIWPPLLAVATGVGFIALIYTPWGAPLGALCAAVCLIGWFWPHGPGKELLEEQP